MSPLPQLTPFGYISFSSRVFALDYQSHPGFAVKPRKGPAQTFPFVGLMVHFSRQMRVP